MYPRAVDFIFYAVSCVGFCLLVALWLKQEFKWREEQGKRRMRKPLDYEPLYLKIPLSILQEHLIGYDAVPFSHQPTSISEVTQLKEAIMALSAQVQMLVDQVTASKSVEASSAAALAQLVTQAKANADQIATLMAQVASGTSLSPADAAALTQAATDLHDSATALQAAVPANADPAAPATPIPPAAPASP